MLQHQISWIVANIHDKSAFFSKNPVEGCFWLSKQPSSPSFIQHRILDQCKKYQFIFQGRYSCKTCLITRKYPWANANLLNLSRCMLATYFSPPQPANTPKGLSLYFHPLNIFLSILFFIENDWKTANQTKEFLKNKHHGVFVTYALLAILYYFSDPTILLTTYYQVTRPPTCSWLSHENEWS